MQRPATHILAENGDCAPGIGPCEPIWRVFPRDRRIEQGQRCLRAFPLVPAANFFSAHHGDMV